MPNGGPPCLLPAIVEADGHGKLRDAQMATCPRCLGPLSDGHKCKPIWVKRLIRQMTASVVGGLFGAFVQLLLEPHSLPVLGFVIGGLLFFGFGEAMRD